MSFTKKERVKFNKKDYNAFILGGDIGGTNANFGVFGVKNNFPKLLVYYHFESKKIKDIYSAIIEVLDDSRTDYGINIARACFGVAGAVSPKRDFVHLTNAKLDLSTKKILAETGLRKVWLMNDFEAVGYGINMISKKDIKTIKKSEKTPKAPVVVIGAGTGLGKSLLPYNGKEKIYIPIPSEADHSDFPAQNEEEFNLVEFIRKKKKIQRVSNGDVLSGEGLVSIYYYLRENKRFNETECTKEIDKSGSNPELISKYRKIDKTCKASFQIFKRAYANFAKNMALDGLALGGVYIAGGIAPKNKEIFDKEFVKIFEYSHKMGHVLKKIPIYLILNYNIGLLGAGFFGAKQK